jgi:hypothetical protein
MSGKHVLERGRGPLHAQRQQDPIADEILPSLAADPLEHDAGHQIHQVLVLVGTLDQLRRGQNLTMQMSMRRSTRLSNGFSKKAENHAHPVAIHFMHYNFVRIQ